MPITRSSRRAVFVALGAVWLGAVVFGLGALATYDNRPGTPASAPVRWPADSRLPRADGRPTLVMLVHPRCTCSRASLAELAELVARARIRPTTIVVMVKPEGVASDWEKTDLWRTAAQIPAVTVVRDDGGVEARRFGTLTSGQVLLYGMEGTLLFSGGITAARGHPGESTGRASILALLDREEAHDSRTPVFGCPLLSPGDDLRAMDGHDHGVHTS